MKPQSKLGYLGCGLSNYFKSKNRSCCNLMFTDLLKVVETTCISLVDKILDNQLASSLLTTCSRLVIIKPEQAMRTHPDIDLMTARQQACSRLAATCTFLTVYTRKNLTTCSKSANKPSTSCVRTACYKLSTSLEQAVNNL